MRSSLKQLVIILGDGNISESQSLPAQIRETTMKSGVLFVFIILDNPKMSLLDRQVGEVTDTVHAGPGQACSADPC